MCHYVHYTYSFSIIIIYIFIFVRFISSWPPNIQNVEIYEYILVFIKIAIWTANYNYLLRMTSILVIAQNIANYFFMTIILVKNG